MHYARIISYVFLLALTLQSCQDAEEETQTTTEKLNPTDFNKKIPYTLVNQYPHSTFAFTEGLQYVDNHIYESTGQYGKSYVSKSNLENGKTISIYHLDNKYFGEGMTVLGDNIYMLTYKAQEGFVFDKQTFKLKNTFKLKTAECWGMTNDSTNLIYGDGTANLYFLDATSFQEVKRIEVRDNYGIVSAINELEYIKGYIYANQWNTDYILKIDPNNGKVVGQADLSDLRRKTGIPQPQMGNEDAPEVLNGIAYDADNNRIFVTGKNWPKIFEIKLDN